MGLKPFSTAPGNALLNTMLGAMAQNTAEAREAQERRYVLHLLSYLERMSEQNTDTLQKVQERLNQPEFQRVQTNLRFEATREAMDERLRMLAAATAGSAFVELTIGESARVERKLRELDPEDVEALWIIDRTVGNVDLDGTVSVATDSLDSSLLWRSSGGFGGVQEVRATVLGHNILTILEDYLREKVSDEKIPGRHTRPGDRSPGDVQKVIADHPELTELIDRLVGPQAAPRLDASAQYILPNSQGEPFLSINFRLEQKTEFVKDALSAIPTVNSEFELDYTEEPIPLQNPADSWVRGQIRIRGKHDVLRTIANSYRWLWHSAG